MNEETFRLVNSKAPSDRKKAISEFLSSEKWHENRSLVERFLRDSDKSIRTEMSNAICKQDPEIFEIELRYIAQGQDPDLQLNALKTLSKLKSISNVNIFIQRIPEANQELEEDMKNNLVEMLQVNQSEVLKNVFESFSDNDESVRDTALGIFAKASNKPSSVKSFLTYVQSVSPSIRSTIYAVAKKKLVLFATLCTQALKVETDSSLRIQALSVLKHFEDRAIEDLLIQEIENEDWTLRRFAMTSLGEIKSEKGKVALMELLENPDKAIDAIAALKKFEDPEMGAVYISRLGKASHKEQLILLDAIQVTAKDDARYIEPLIVFAAHEVSGEDAKLSALKIAESICTKTDTAIPEQVSTIKKQINDLKRANVPDLGLRLARED